jgi:hypothetical protein
MVVGAALGCDDHNLSANVTVDQRRDDRLSALATNVADSSKLLAFSALHCEPRQLFVAIGQVGSAGLCQFS